MNHVLELAEDLGGLDSFDGLCMELVDEALHIWEDADILWVEPVVGDRLLGKWRFHAVVVIAGIVHDAWHPTVLLPPRQYVATVFGDVKWELNPGRSE